MTRFLSSPARRAAVIIALTVAPAALARAQDAPPAFNTLRTPSSPAFVLLGVEPSSVERPNSPSDFAAALQQATRDFSSLPRDFAIELSPYWLLGTHASPWTDDTSRSIGQSLARTLTISAATAELGTDNAPVQGAAVSVRASLVSGRMPRRLQQQIRRIEHALARESAAYLEQLRGPAGQAVDALLVVAVRANPALATAASSEVRAALATPTPGVADAALPARVETARRALGTLVQVIRTGPFSADTVARAAFDSATVEEHLARLLESGGGDAPTEEGRGLERELQDFAAVREGLFVEIAGGLAIRAPGRAADSADVDRWGGWLTVSYDRSRLSFVGVLRYLDSRLAGADDAVDVGGRFIYSRNDMALSAEYVHRHLVDAGGPDQWRVAGMAEYRLSRNLWAQAVFGRDFDDTAPGSLLARLGLSFQVSKKRFEVDGGE